MSASADDETWFGKSFPSYGVSNERLRGEGCSWPLARGQSTEHKIIDLAMLKEPVLWVVSLGWSSRYPLMEVHCKAFTTEKRDFAPTVSPLALNWRGKVLNITLIDETFFVFSLLESLFATTVRRESFK